MTRLYVVVVLLVSALAACDDDPTPNIPDPTPTSSTPTMTDSVSPTTPTATPEPLTPEETVRAWVEARNAAVQDGDISAAVALSTSDCSTCRDSLVPIQEVYDNGGHYETSGWKVASTKESEATDSNAVVTAGLVYASGMTIPEAGADPVTYETERHIAEFRLSNHDGPWLVTFLGYIS